MTRLHYELERMTNYGEERAEAERRRLLGGLATLLEGMELHDDLPDSHDLGYMVAWREVKAWLDATVAAEDGPL